MSKMKSKKPQPSVVDHVQKLDRVDALELGKLDAEIRNALQGQRLSDYEISAIRTQANERISFLELNKAKLAADVEKMRPLYEDLLKKIATKLGIDDPKHLVFDPDSGIVRDARSLLVRE